MSFRLNLLVLEGSVWHAPLREIVNFVVTGFRVSVSPEQGAGPTLDTKEEAALLGSVHLTLLDYM